MPESWVITNLKNICKSINAGGDKPCDTLPNKTNINRYPVIANGLQNEGIIGYSSTFSVSEKCLTMSGRGTIGYPMIRDYCFTPIVRLLVIKPLLDYIDIDYLAYLLTLKCNNGVGTSIQQLTVPMIVDIPIKLAPIKEQIRISKTVSSLFNMIESI